MSRSSGSTPARAISAASAATTAACSRRSCRDRAKNPTGQHRCWASINNKDDQLYKVSRELFRSQAVVFFVSVRWGQTNSVYQRLFERLSWIENRVTSLGEEPIPQLKKLEAGIVLFGHNWNDEQVLKTQKQNFKWFGWKTPAALSFYWQYTRDADEESPESYLGAVEEFRALLRTLPPFGRLAGPVKGGPAPPFRASSRIHPTLAGPPASGRRARARRRARPPSDGGPSRPCARVARRR